ncbi:MAG: hypothetical protein R6V01_00940 [Thermoplasmatota archaeon]
MSEGTPENAQEMLMKAEMALADGNFIKARSISRQASSILERTQKLHRRFMDRMKDFLDKIGKMEERGYDITEASQLMSKARASALKSDYDAALDLMEKLPPAIERATYLPFPLLNKTVDIKSTIFYSMGKVNYTVRIENPMNEPLGEMIIHPFLNKDEFHEVQEKYYGVVGPMEYKEYTFELTPKVKDWSLGVGRDVLVEEGVILRTNLSSRGGTAKYFITVENNSDQILRDIRLSPMAPAGLESDPREAVIEFIEPFAQKTVEFNLYPMVLREQERPRNEKYILVEEEGPEDERSWIEQEEVWETEVNEEEPSIDEGLDLDALKEDIIEIDEGPRDFTPVREDYDLISMSPMRYPEGIEKEMRSKK